uniref:Uncharacterized protein n=1 Tax=Buteo japonicus TaxID=224669 RepID=A0A8C0BIP5_9AVES
MGVRDNLPSCPHIPDKDFSSCQPILDAAPVSSVPQFTLSHRRLVPCILPARSGASALGSSGAAHRGGLGPAGEPRRAASPLCPWGLAGPAEPVQECRAGRVWHLGTGGPCGGGSRGGSSPRQWDGVSGAGQVKFLVMGCQGPKAETRWSDPILLRRVNSHFTSPTASSLPGCGTTHPLLCPLPRSRTSLVPCLPGPPISATKRRTCGG